MWIECDFGFNFGSNKKIEMIDTLTEVSGSSEGVCVARKWNGIILYLALAASFFHPRSRISASHQWIKRDLAMAITSWSIFSFSSLILLHSVCLCVPHLQLAICPISRMQLHFINILESQYNYGSIDSWSEFDSDWNRATRYIVPEANGRDLGIVDVNYYHFIRIERSFSRLAAKVIGEKASRRSQTHGWR